MKYHLLKPDGFITGPFELETIEAQLEAGEISPDTLATGDIGESLGQVRSTPAEDWMPVQSIPGFGLERELESAPLAAADEIRFCPGCAHQLPAGEPGVCERCGRALGFAPPPPPPPVPTVTLLPIGGSKSGRVLAGAGKVLGGLFLTLLLLGGGLLFFGFLLLILVGSKCRA